MRSVARAVWIACAFTGDPARLPRPTRVGVMGVGGSRHPAISCGIAVKRVSVARRPPVLRWRSRPPIPPRIPVRSRPDGWQRACTYAPIASTFLGDGPRCLHHLRVACRPVTRCNPRRRAVAPARPEPDRGSFLETPSAAASVGHERSVVAALVAVYKHGASSAFSRPSSRRRRSSGRRRVGTRAARPRTKTEAPSAKVGRAARPGFQLAAWWMAPCPHGTRRGNRPFGTLLGHRFSSLLTASATSRGGRFRRSLRTAAREEKKRSSIGPLGRTDERSSRTLEAGDGTRTRDIQLGKLTLYQLSYTRVGGHTIAPAFALRNGSRSRSNPRIPRRR